MSLLNKFRNIEISSFVLHILAMVFMLSDHLRAKVFPDQVRMTCLWRLAFPIFAFLIVEWFYHTKWTPKFKKYILRMLFFAVITEIPFNLMYWWSIFYYVHQNVLWTYLIALIWLYFIDKFRQKWKRWNFCSIPVILIWILLPTITMCDFWWFWVMMIFTFYFFHGRKWWHFLWQFILMFYINYELMWWLCYNIELFWYTFEIVQQSFALLALPIIWLYKWKQGHHSKIFKYSCYAFYPVHSLILWIFAS